MNITKNEYTYSILFKICAEIADQRALEFGKLEFDKMPKKFHNNIVVMTSVLQMFMKCGDITKAEQLFNRIQNKNLIVFSVMMNGKKDLFCLSLSLFFFQGYVLNKLEERAIDLFFKTEKPDEITLTIFFNACAQAATEKALTLGKKVFDQLRIECNPSSDVLYSVLNMFIKCDDLENAESLFERIDRDIVSYGSMMKLYNIKDEPQKTVELFQRMKLENLNPNEIIFVLLIDALSVIGDLSLSQTLIDEISEKFLLDRWIQVGLIDLWVKFF